MTTDHQPPSMPPTAPETSWGQVLLASLLGMALWVGAVRLLTWFLR